MRHIHKHTGAGTAAEAADDIDELVVAHHRKAAVLRHLQIADLVQGRVFRLQQSFEGDVVAEEGEPPDGPQLFGAVVDIAERDRGVVPPASDFGMIFEVVDEACCVEFAHIGRFIGVERLLIEPVDQRFGIQRQQLDHCRQCFAAPCFAQAPFDGPHSIGAHTAYADDESRINCRLFTDKRGPVLLHIWLPSYVLCSPF